ncbi:hypothetical protein VTN77DRAFT_7206 [Rasamsonia byssochlamydoides]|uniref:uncharacterized protein n=1 Tax=Rasamsonia byssochlamydoides TaxID=89139 RepID=UPI0037436634
MDMKMNMNIYLHLYLLVVLSGLAGLAAAAHDTSQSQTQAQSPTTGSNSGGNSNQDDNNNHVGGGGGSGAAAAATIQAQLPYIILLTLGSLAAITAIYHLASRVAAHIRKLTSLNNQTQRAFVQPHPILAVLKKHLIYAPLLGTRHNNEFKLKLGRSGINMGAVPGRLPTLLIAGLVAMNLVLLLIDIPFLDPEQEVAGMLVSRAGTLTVINLFPLIFIAGRNNILIKLTGVSFDTFNLFHRWLARIVVLEAITHALSYIIPAVQQGGFAAFLQSVRESTQILTGLVTVIMFTTLMLHSFSALRHAFYETFLHMHILVVAAALVAVWYHLDGYPQQVWIVAAIGAWIGERVTRLAILLFRNVGKGGTTALVEALPGDTLRVSIRMARPWRFRPGQHLYLYVPSVGLWTSHPFSVAWSEGQETLSEDKGLVMTRQDMLSTTTLSLLIRRKKGFTDQLYKRAANSAFGRVSLKAFAEGPYGSLHSLDSYGTVMLFAGGVGITHLVPFTRHLVAGFADGTVATRRLTLIWTVQSLDHLEWIRPWMKTIIEMTRCEEILRVQIFITRLDDVPSINNNNRPDSIIQMSAGRPQIDVIVAAEASQQVGAMGVMVCGAGSLGDDVRRVCRKRQSLSTIDYMEESFTW